MSGLKRLARYGLEYPYDFEDIVLVDGGTQMNFDQVPILAEHVTIPPHDKVSSAKHSYSFLEDGSELCFHSPSAVSDGSQRLSTWLSGLGNTFLGGNFLISADTATEQLNALVSSDKEDAGFEFAIDTASQGRGLASWLAWGDFLSAQYAIEQYAFVTYEP